MTSLALDLRLSCGFRLMSKRPELSVTLEPSTPMNDDRLTTSASFEDRRRRAPAASSAILAKEIVLRGLRHALDDAGVLHRKEALGDRHIEIAGERERAERDQQRQALMVEHDGAASRA